MGSLVWAFPADYPNIDPTNANAEDDSAPWYVGEVLEINVDSSTIKVKWIGEAQRDSQLPTQISVASVHGKVSDATASHIRDQLAQNGSIYSATAYRFSKDLGRITPANGGYRDISPATSPGNSQPDSSASSTLEHLQQLGRESQDTDMSDQGSNPSDPILDQVLSYNNNPQFDKAIKWILDGTFCPETVRRCTPPVVDVIPQKAVKDWQEIALTFVQFFRRAPEGSEAQARLLLFWSCMPKLVLHGNTETMSQNHIARNIRKNRNLVVQGNWPQLVKNLFKHWPPKVEKSADEWAQDIPAQDAAHVQLPAARTIDQKVKRAMHLSKQGAYTKSMRTLRSHGMANTISQDTLNTIKDKHPDTDDMVTPLPEYPTADEFQTNEAGDIVDSDKLWSLIRSAPSMKSQDEFGWQLKEHIGPLCHCKDLRIFIAKSILTPFILGTFHCDLAAPLFDLRGHLISKAPKPGIRPLGQKSVWPTLAIRYILSIERENLATFQRHLNQASNYKQYANAIPDGATQLFLSLLLRLPSPEQLDPSDPDPWVLILYDVKNAFPEIRRRTFFDFIRGVATQQYDGDNIQPGDSLESTHLAMPSLHQHPLKKYSALLDAQYARKVDYRVHTKDGIVTKKFAQGSVQGDPFGSHCFTAGTQLPSDRVAKRHPEISIDSYADNFFMSGRASKVFPALADHANVLRQECGLRVNEDESFVFCPALQSIDGDEPPALLQELFRQFPDVPLKWQKRGCNILGYPLGSDEFIKSFLDKKLDSVLPDLSLIQHIPDGLVYYTLLRFCVCTRLQYLYRGLAPDLTIPIAKKFDHAIMDSFFEYSGVNLDKANDDLHQDWIKHLVKSSIDNAGFNIVSNELHTKAAYYAGVARSLHNLTLDPSFAEKCSQAGVSLDCFENGQGPTTHTSYHFWKLTNFFVANGCQLSPNPQDERAARRFTLARQGQQGNSPWSPKLPALEILIKGHQYIHITDPVHQRDLTKFVGDLAYRARCEHLRSSAHPEPLPKGFLAIEDHLRRRKVAFHESGNPFNGHSLVESGIEIPVAAHQFLNCMNPAPEIYFPKILWRAWICVQFRLPLPHLVTLPGHELRCVYGCDAILDTKGYHLSNCAKSTAAEWQAGHELINSSVEIEIVRSGLKASTRPIDQPSHQARHLVRPDCTAWGNADFDWGVSPSNRRFNYASFDVTMCTFFNHEGVCLYPSFENRMKQAEKTKRDKYNFIPNGSQDPGLFLPLVFSPLGFVSDTVARLAWILASVQAHKIIEEREWSASGSTFKFYRAVFYRRVLSHLQTAAIMSGMRRYFKDRPAARRVFGSPYSGLPLPEPYCLPRDADLNLHAGPSLYS